MAGVKVIANDTEFQPELSAAGSRLAVVKFTMRGCGPCLRIAPAFNALSNKYPQATFLEVDVHQCQGTAATNNISATPTFLFFRNKVRIDQYQGADAVGLEDKIKQHLENDPGNSEDTDIPKGYMDLLPFINKAGCECLNESDEHGFENCLRKDSSYLESDCDEQLLITVAFSQPVKLYSMKLQGPDNVVRAVQSRRRRDDEDHLLHLHWHPSAGHQHERLQTSSGQEGREPLGSCPGQAGFAVSIPDGCCREQGLSLGLCHSQ
uniref:thioredoxin-like protein 1 isoform X2 n=1 Tax=Agelaius phoeniceus TaxID=39638 RepID=UPI0023EB0F1A|nr:thioredoxin-like protein 1 isoform X2 [Agelaius phoeniceus]